MVAPYNIISDIETNEITGKNKVFLSLKLYFMNLGKRRQ